MNDRVSTTEKKIFIPGPVGQLEAILADAQDSTSQQSTNLESKRIDTRIGMIGVICHPHPLFKGTLHNKVVTTIAKTWQQMGLRTLRFNFRGVGLSEGEHAHGKGEIEDLEAVLNWLSEHYLGSCGRFWLGGFSFGAFISIEVATQKTYPIDALLSVAPPLRFFTHTEETLPSAPWIIIHGEQDELVPHEEVLSWYHRIKQRKSDVQLISFKDTSHFFHGRLTDLKTEIMNAMGPLKRAVKREGNGRSEEKT